MTLFVATVHDGIFKDEYTEMALLIRQTGAISRLGLDIGNQATYPWRLHAPWFISSL
jgi:hypothetical protein